MKTALILAGAGARGIIQAGMIKAFVDLGLEYDALYGSSVGSLNGAMLHAGQVDEMVELWMNVRNKDVYTWAPWNMFIKNKGCLYDSTPLLKLIQRSVDLQKAYANPKPFTVNVTNLSEKSVFGFKNIPRIDLHPSTTAKALEQMLWASASPPVLMAPVPLDNILLTDGGLTNNYSIIDAVHDGADRLILLAPMMTERKPINHIIDAIDQTVSIQLVNQLDRELRAVKLRNGMPGYRDIEVVLVTTDQPSGIGILDFDIKDKQAQINYGYKLATEKLRGLAA